MRRTLSIAPAAVLLACAACAPRIRVGTLYSPWPIREEIVVWSDIHENEILFSVGVTEDGEVVARALYDGDDLCPDAFRDRGGDPGP